MTTQAEAAELAQRLNAAGYPELRVEVGLAFEDARIEQGLTLRDLADKAGLAHGTIHQFERGTDNPTLDRLARMASAYGRRLRIILEPLP